MKKKLEQSVKETLEPLEEEIRCKRIRLASMENTLSEKYVEIQKVHRFETMNIEDKGDVINGQRDAEQVKLGLDMSNQLERVSIPVFSGDKREYPGWRSAFDQCIDNAPSTPQYKLLQLKQYQIGRAHV